MKDRNFTAYLTPKTGGADRRIHVKALNYGEAEAMVAAMDEIGENEFISTISCELPKDE